MNKAPGVDLLGTRMLIELTDEIADMVAILFSKSLRSGDVPQDWRLANVSARYDRIQRWATSLMPNVTRKRCNKMSWSTSLLMVLHEESHSTSPIFVPIISS